MGYRFAAVVFGIVFEEFTKLEEQHNEDCLWKFRLRTGQESDKQCAYCGNAHEKVFVEDFPLHDALYSFADNVVADKQKRHEVDEQQLPYLQSHGLLHNHGGYKQYGSKDNP